MGSTLSSQFPSECNISTHIPHTGVTPSPARTYSHIHTPAPHTPFHSLLFWNTFASTFASPRCPPPPTPLPHHTRCCPYTHPETPHHTSIILQLKNSLVGEWAGERGLSKGRPAFFLLPQALSQERSPERSSDAGERPRRPHGLQGYLAELNPSVVFAQNARTIPGCQVQLMVAMATTHA